MGLFDIFKKHKEILGHSTDNGVPGPTYLEEFTTHVDRPKNLHPHEWRRKISNNGQSKFKIKYYGQLDSSHKNLIVGTAFSKPLIFAIDIVTNQEILLWDGCKHGYNPIFCDDFNHAQLHDRKAVTFYKDFYQKDIFEITISTFNQFDFDEEMGGDVDTNGFLELDNGQKMKFEEVKRNAFDSFRIVVTNEDGKTTEIVSEELA